MANRRLGFFALVHSQVSFAVFVSFLRYVTFTRWHSYVLKLIRLDTLTLSDATLCDVYVVLCYVLSQFVYQQPTCVDFVHNRIFVKYWLIFALHSWNKNK
jgi:hypothetical protein